MAQFQLGCQKRNGYDVKPLCSATLLVSRAAFFGRYGPKWLQHKARRYLEGSQKFIRHVCKSFQDDLIKSDFQANDDASNARGVKSSQVYDIFFVFCLAVS